MLLTLRCFYKNSVPDGVRFASTTKQNSTRLACLLHVYAAENAVQGMPLIWAGACARPHATAVKIAPLNVIQLPEQKQLTTLLASRL
jgi:hypothetical protein